MPTSTTMRYVVYQQLMVRKIRLGSELQALPRP